MSLSQGLGLIFDLDGVIVDSMPLHTETWLRYLARFNVPSDDLERRMHGRRNDDIVRDFFGAHLTPEEVFRHGAEKEALFREIMRPQLAEHLAPGAVDFVTRHAGVPMAVASNAEPANIDFVLVDSGLRRYFRAVVDGMQVERPKPFPDVYLKAAAELGIAPSNCIVFEDSPVGVRAAREAGARVVGVETHEALDDVSFRISDFRDAGLEAWLSTQEPL
ncbi:MAG: HAD family phosphatase [Acidobacteria bacterium]|nr:HAD family phosphatase [Acidobacteriota bacterium]